MYKYGFQKNKKSDLDCTIHSQFSQQQIPNKKDPKKKLFKNYIPQKPKTGPTARQ